MALIAYGTDPPSDPGSYQEHRGPNKSGAVRLVALYLELCTRAVNKSKVPVWPAVKKATPKSEGTYTRRQTCKPQDVLATFEQQGQLLCRNP